MGVAKKAGDARESKAALGRLSLVAKRRATHTPVKRPSGLPPPNVLDSQVLGTYELRDRLGRSLDSELVRAYQIRPDQSPRQCVVRVVCPDDETMREILSLKLFAEGQANIEIRHPNIVETFDYGMLNGATCLVREFVDGVSLHALRSSLRLDLSIGALSYLGWVLADTLDYVHNFVVNPDEDASPSLVHGRLCPSDILVCRDGTPKITEVGQSTRAPQFLGMPSMSQRWRAAYFAPEQLHRRALTARSDLFSLGILLVELVSGAPLSQTGTLGLRELNAAVKARCFSRADLPDALRTLLLRLTAVDPAQRPRSAQEVADDLDAVGAEFGSRIERKGALEALLSQAVAQVVTREATDDLSAHRQTSDVPECGSGVPDLISLPIEMTGSIPSGSKTQSMPSVALPPGPPVEIEVTATGDLTWEGARVHSTGDFGPLVFTQTDDLAAIHGGDGLELLDPRNAPDRVSMMPSLAVSARGTQRAYVPTIEETTVSTGRPRARPPERPRRQPIEQKSGKSWGTWLFVLVVGAVFLGYQILSAVTR